MHICCRLETTYKTRNDYRLAEDVGNLLVRISETCPGGLLVFFPSYVAMDGYIRRWEEMDRDIMRWAGCFSLHSVPLKSAEVKIVSNHNHRSIASKYLTNRWRSVRDFR